jgi:acyl-CoA thioesterase
MALDQEKVRAIFAQCDYARHHEMAITGLEPGLARVAFTVPAWAANAAGRCHGGAIFTLADFAQAVACHTIGREVAMQGNINWLAAVHPGDMLTAEARVMHAGRRTFVVGVEIHNQRGRRVAQATFTSARLLDEDADA